jgi:protein SCO1/2
LDVYDSIGGKFELNSTIGKKIGPQSFRGQVLLVFFGYISCPDICPITLITIKNALETLNANEAKQVQPLFISVDPERDTLEGMQQFLTYFHPSFVGMTGTTEELKSITKHFGAAYIIESRSDSAADYLIAHSGYIYLIDQQGRTRALYRISNTAEEMVEGVRTLLQE